MGKNSIFFIGRVMSHLQVIQWQTEQHNCLLLSQPVLVWWETTVLPPLLEISISIQGMKSTVSKCTANKITKIDFW